MNFHKFETSLPRELFVIVHPTPVMMMMMNNDVSYGYIENNSRQRVLTLSRPCSECDVDSYSWNLLLLSQRPQAMDKYQSLLN